MSVTPSIWVVIPAAGVGKRMKADRPKQYLPLLNKTVLEHTLSCFSSQDYIEGIVISLHENDPYWKELDKVFDKPIYVAKGGKERGDSVLNALNFLKRNLSIPDEQWVMVHDAARPCLLDSDIEALVNCCVESGVGGLLAKKASDTIKQSLDAEDAVVGTVDREKLWHALTPQMFRLGELSKNLGSALEEGVAITDEASAMETYGGNPLLIEAMGSNIKITNPDDLALAEFLLSKNKEV